MEPDIDLKVFYCSSLSVSKSISSDFGTNANWGIPLLDGYKYEFLPSIGPANNVSFWLPWNYGLAARLKQHHIDVLWLHGYARWFHLVAILTANLLGIRVFVRGETTQKSGPKGAGSKITRILFFKILRNLCERFLAIGTQNREYYLHQGIPKNKISMVPYAVDNAFFQKRCLNAKLYRSEFRSSLGLTPGRPIILFVGRLISRKRPGDLLDAYIRLSPDGKKEPHPYLLYVGDGKLRSKLEQKSSRMGWKSILYLGFKNQTEMPALYDLCDVLVLPSSNETWGLVINEAMNAGRPVIASDHVGCSVDLIHNGRNGFTFKSMDFMDLHRILNKFLLSSDRWATMGRESLQIINSWSFEEDIAGIKHALKK